MIRSLTKIVSLMLLLVVIAASHAITISETESNSFEKNINLADTSNDGEADDSEPCVPSFRIAETENIRVNPNAIGENSGNKILSTLSAIRAPPIYYL